MKILAQKINSYQQAARFDACARARNWRLFAN
jgi:hypothetical protein